jgi:hypothetical protein
VKNRFLYEAERSGNGLFGFFYARILRGTFPQITQINTDLKMTSKSVLICVIRGKFISHFFDTSICFVDLENVLFYDVQKSRVWLDKHHLSMKNRGKQPLL